jgi:hypothetical protein
MTKRVRRVVWIGVALCLVALAFGLTVRLLGPELAGVTEANARRIRPGMSLTEAERILGSAGYPLLRGEAYIWDGREGQVLVVIDERGRVGEAVFVPFRDLRPLDRFRAWLGW